MMRILWWAVILVFMMIGMMTMMMFRCTVYSEEKM